MIASFIRHFLFMEVVITLPTLTVVLTVVSKRRALNERVLVFMSCEFGIAHRQIREHLVCSVEGVWGFILKDVLCNVCDEKMAIDRPRMAQCRYNTGNQDNHYPKRAHYSNYGIL